MLAIGGWSVPVASAGTMEGWQVDGGCDETLLYGLCLDFSSQVLLLNFFLENKNIKLGHGA